MIYLTLKPIEDEDPLILKFKNTCHEKMGGPRYKSWIEPLVMRKDSSGRIICRAPNRWFAEHIAMNDMLGFGSFIKSIGVPAIAIEYEGKGGHQGFGTKIAGRIYSEPYVR